MEVTEYSRFMNKMCLFIIENVIGNDGLKTLCEVLKNNNSLTKLDLGCEVFEQNKMLIKGISMIVWDNR